MALFPAIFKQRLAFIPPRLQSGEWDRNEDAAELAVPAYIRRPAHERVLEWTVAPPRRPGNYYLRSLGQTDYAFVRVQPCDCGQPDCHGVVADVPKTELEWFGPLLEPRA